MDFFIDLIHQLVCDGHRVDIACNAESKLAKEYSDLGCSVFHLDCSRSPLSKGNLFCVGQIRKIVENNRYDIVHCHTPIAAACTRIACRDLRKKGLRVFYTAHGFHFYKGAPLKNWLIYYPVEWLLSWYTDVLITINREDYKRAKKRLHVRKVFYIPGVGIDLDKFNNRITNQQKKRIGFNINSDDKIVLSIGELNDNKNHKIVIDALAELRISMVTREYDKIHYFIVGRGEKYDELKSYAKNKKVNIHLLGYRVDVADILRIADVYVLPSKREGLNVSLMEAMASGVPCIASDIRGNNDLIDSRYRFAVMDVEKLKQLIKSILFCNVNSRDTYKVNINIFNINRISRKVKELYIESINY